MQASLSPRWSRSQGRPLLLGHRGARHAAPENTFAAFDLALEEGAEGVELDVRLNASGDVIVCHDVGLERVTAGRDARAVHTLTSADCAAVRLEGGERLPRLDDVLDWAEQHHAIVNVELKSDGRRRRALVAAVARLLRARATPGDFLVSCFNPLVVLAHRALAPALATAWLVDRPQALRLSTLLPIGSAAVHPRAALVTAERMRGWRASRQRVHVWTVNDPARARELARLGVDALISDHPAALRAALELAS